jgi:uncharacterized membrane protein YciS (DUF1049 family)
MTDPAVTPLAAAELARQKLAQRDNAIRAAAIRQGREAERKELEAERARLEGQHAGQLEGVTKAHEAELKRVGKLIGKAAFREGGLLGMVFGMGLAASIIAGTYWIVKDAVILNTATQRVNHSLEAGQVPSLSDSYRNAEPPTGEPIRRAP